MLAISSVSPEWAAVIFGVALILFIVGTIIAWPAERVAACVSAGLAFVTFVAFWNSLAAA